MKTEPAYIMYGSQVTLTCSATSYTPPSQMGIKRYGQTVATKNWQAIDITTAAEGQLTRSIQFTIHNVTLDEDGDYYCIGVWFSPYANISSKYILKVYSEYLIVLSCFLFLYDSKGLMTLIPYYNYMTINREDVKNSGGKKAGCLFPAAIFRSWLY